MISCKISVIVPVYNAGRYLCECVESILSQSFRDFELILINDGSRDDSGLICDEYEKTDVRVCVFHQENSGVSVARNVGLDNANGEWITFVDADDYLPNQALEILYNTAIQSQADYVYGNTLRRNESTERLCMRKIKRNVWKNNFDTLVHFGLWGHLFKASVIIRNNVRFVEGQAYGEDMLFKYYLLKNVSVMASVSDVVYVYRINSESVTQSTDKLRSAHHQLMATKHLIDFAKSVDNRKFKKTLMHSVQSSQMQIYRDVAFNPNKNERILIINDYYEVLGDTVVQRITLYYNVYMLRVKRIIKTIIS